MNKILCLLATIIICVQFAYAENSDIEKLYIGKWKNVESNDMCEIIKLKTGLLIKLEGKEYLGYMDNRVLFYMENNLGAKVPACIDSQGYLLISEFSSKLKRYNKIK